MKATNKPMHKSKVIKNNSKKQPSVKKPVHKVAQRTLTTSTPRINLSSQSSLQTPKQKPQFATLKLSSFQPQLRLFSTTSSPSDPFQQAPPPPVSAPGKFPFQPKKFTPPVQQFNFNAKKTLNQTNEAAPGQDSVDLEEMGEDDSSADFLEFNSDGADNTSDQSSDSDLPLSYKRQDNLSSDSEASRNPISILQRLPKVERQELMGQPTMLHPIYSQHNQSDSDISTDAAVSYSGSDSASESNSNKSRKNGDKSDHEGGKNSPDNNSDQVNSEENELAPYKGTSTFWKKTSSKDVTLQEGRPFLSDIEGPLMFSDDPFYSEEEKPYQAFYNDQFSSSGELDFDDFETMGTAGLLHNPARAHELLDVVSVDKNMKWQPGKAKIQLPRLKPGRPIPKGWMVTESGHCVPEGPEHVHHKYADPDLYQTPVQERLRDVVQAKLPKAFKLSPAEQESFMEVTQSGHHSAYTRHRARVLDSPVINSVVAKINARRGDPKINDFDQNIDLSIQLQNVSPFVRKYKHDFSAQGHAFLDIPKSTIDLIRDRKRSPHRLPGPSMDFSFQNTAYHKATH